MTKAMHHVRANAIAYLALFVALGGTGYAAIDLGPRSVGARELKTGAVTTRVLRNGSVTARKLDGNSIPLSPKAWARITPSGHVLAGSPGARVMTWGAGNGLIAFGARFRTGCVSQATVEAGAIGFISATAGSTSGGGIQVVVNMADPMQGRTTLPITVVVVCPGG
jgi:hypothetical protein